MADLQLPVPDDEGHAMHIGSFFDAPVACHVRRLWRAAHSLDVA